MKKILLFVVIVTGLSDCRKTPDFSQLSDNFVTATNRDKAADFSAFKTYYISDTIKYIGGVGDDSIIVGNDADQIIQTVKDNMGSRGYIFIPRNANPDLGLTLTAIKDLNVIVDYYPGWWDPYWGCYWYYWCYPYYYPWTAVYTYTVGTVILNMYDLQNATKNLQLKAIWNITALGALGTGTPNVKLGKDAINQGFEQSPYVQTN